LAERLAVAERHFDLFCAESGERVALREMRKHFSWYAKGVAGASLFRAEINRLADRDEVLMTVRSFFNGETDHG
jgi:tRNA-dihydrouridine synthase